MNEKRNKIHLFLFAFAVVIIILISIYYAITGKYLWLFNNQVVSNVLEKDILYSEHYGGKDVVKDNLKVKMATFGISSIEKSHEVLMCYDRKFGNYTFCDSIKVVLRNGDIFERELNDCCGSAYRVYLDDSGVKFYGRKPHDGESKQDYLHELFTDLDLLIDDIKDNSNEKIAKEKANKTWGQ